MEYRTHHYSLLRKTIEKPGKDGMRKHRRCSGVGFKTLQRFTFNYIHKVNVLV